MSIIMNGAKLAKIEREKLHTQVVDIQQKHQKQPGLVVIIVGEDPASCVYVKNKRKIAKELGFNSFEENLPTDTSKEKLHDIIQSYNQNPDVHGILVQSPLPDHLDEKEAFNLIRCEKDVDGFHIQNVGKLTLGEPAMIPCTPKGVMKLLEHYSPRPISGEHAVVIGRSQIVGIPMANLLRNANATVTICHSRTKDITLHTKQAGIVISAVGKPNFLSKDDFRHDAIVVDVGINRTEDGLTGDVDFDNVKEHVAAITPVPKGVGPMTIAMLMKNTFETFLKQEGISI